MGDDTVLMAIEDTWIDENDHIHVEMFAPAPHFSLIGVPEESSVLSIPSGEPRDYSLLDNTDK